MNLQEWNPRKKGREAKAWLRGNTKRIGVHLHDVREQRIKGEDEVKTSQIWTCLLLISLKR